MKETAVTFQQTWILFLVFGTLYILATVGRIAFLPRQAWRVALRKWASVLVLSLVVGSGVVAAAIQHLLTDPPRLSARVPPLGVQIAAIGALALAMLWLYDSA